MFSSYVKDLILRKAEDYHSKVLVKEKEELDRKYSSESAVIPKPDYWGGYLVKPDTVEFWCGRSDRLHDRIQFRRPSPTEVPDEKLTHTGEDGWVYEYLSP
ncbi:hypothetical protein AVEN_90325-1 [Araneus ventricosus]|uniref:pyridoxal 5'-phosphate synthase n=2 Tax=Araneus ventricosus TaxID=182803 RepID=A0A4Y2VPI0_ARAVE|nr:hypothetical protein AVEN_90325-1 [Araneus ventricosus]